MSFLCCFFFGVVGGGGGWGGGYEEFVFLKKLNSQWVNSSFNVSLHVDVINVQHLYIFKSGFPLDRKGVKHCNLKSNQELNQPNTCIVLKSSLQDLVHSQK